QSGALLDLRLRPLERRQSGENLGALSAQRCDPTGSRGRSRDRRSRARQRGRGCKIAVALKDHALEWMAAEGAAYAHTGPRPLRGDGSQAAASCGRGRTFRACQSAPAGPGGEKWRGGGGTSCSQWWHRRGEGGGGMTLQKPPVASHADAFVELEN